MMLSLMMVALLGSTLDDKSEPPDPNAPKARELKVKLTAAPRRQGGLKEAIKITSKKELQEHFSSKEDQEAILKEVDLKKEVILLFAWSGSGRDRLSMNVEKEVAVFSLKQGETPILRMHTKVYALPAKMKYKMEK